MPARNVGLLHPGTMGVTVGAAIAGRGHQVLWASDDRSASTTRRAADAQFDDVQTIAGLVASSEFIIAVCPPHAALEVAQAVAAMHFDGVYVDANAIAPSTAAEIAATIGDGFVDGGIIGPPATQAGTTRLYLSGPAAERVTALFSGSDLEAIAVGTQPGTASALKMAYAAYTKGSAALITAVRALAHATDIEDLLLNEWDRSIPGLRERSDRTFAGVAPKAWRFAGEMDEIAATFATAGLPDGFHLAAADVYRRLARFRDGTADPAAMMAALHGADGNPSNGPEEEEVRL